VNRANKSGHDIIVIGGSLGSIESLRELATGLPKTISASLFVTVHLLPYANSRLPRLLSMWGDLPAKHPKDREVIAAGKIYVAPPDHHLLVGSGFCRVVKGLKENNTRPAIDPLFRTAAVSYGPRVVAVLLSGMLDDGTSGAAAVRARGGLVVVQDPADALCPDMPANAIRSAEVDYTRPVSKIAPLLVELARTPVNETKGSRAMPEDLEYEANVAQWDVDALQSHKRPGTPSPFVCPNCKGDLWEIQQEGLFHFRCRIGHAFSPLALLASQAEALDDTLNEAFRALKEKAHMEARMAKRVDAADYHEKQAQDNDQHASVIREMLLKLEDRLPIEPSTLPDGSREETKK
jgi:two-component system chemotaxis response regulator CheB